MMIGKYKDCLEVCMLCLHRIKLIYYMLYMYTHPVNAFSFFQIDNDKNNNKKLDKTMAMYTMENTKTQNYKTNKRKKTVMSV